jgi:ribonuclease HI
MGTEIGMLGSYGFQGQVTAGDGSDKQGKMGAGYNDLRRKKKKQQCKVGREEEGSSSNQPELAAFFQALRDTLIEELLLYFCDNQSLLKAVTRWIGEGGKATLVGSLDVDILAASIEILRKRIAAGTATFLVKVKEHRGEPANEGADILADKAISDPKVGTEWCQRTNRAVFTWRKPCREAGKVTYQDHHSTFNNSVRDAIQRGAAEHEVQKHEEKLTGVWKQMSTLRRRYESGVKVTT